MLEFSTSSQLLSHYWLFYLTCTSVPCIEWNSLRMLQFRTMKISLSWGLIYVFKVLFFKHTFMSIKFTMKKCWSCRQSMLYKHLFYACCIDMHLNRYNINLWLKAMVMCCSPLDFSMHRYLIVILWSIAIT